MSKLPDFLIIGAARCGTSSLFVNLLKHPQICGPHLPNTKLLNEKECHFFDKKINNPKYDIKWYKDCFKSARQNLVFFEATPNYLYHPRVPRAVKRYLPNAKFIVMLRNPVDRAWSHFYHWRRKEGWTEKILMQKNHLVVKKGVYWEQLERWFKHFKREQFFIIKSEDFYLHEKRVIDKCFEFLSLKPPQYKTGSVMYWDPKREYLIGPRTYPGPSYKIVRWLTTFYRPHNEKLEAMLGRKFGWH